MTVYIKKILKYTFSAILMVLAVLVLLAWMPLRYLPLDKENFEAIIIKDVTIVDVVNDSLYPGSNILIRGRHIQKIFSGPLDEYSDTEGKIKIIKGSGMYVMPALWDMHVHLMKLSPYLAYPSFLSHGVNNVREMRGAYNERDPFAGVQSRLKQWNQSVASYELAGPRVHDYSSFAIEGPHSRFDNSPDYFNCAGPEDAQKLVKHFTEKEISLIKIYNNIPREAFFSLMKEANAAGIAVAGHKPVRVGPMEASDAGMKSLEHAKFLIWDSFSRSAELQNHPDPLSENNTALRRMMLDKHDTTKLFEIFKVFRENCTWYCPTQLTRKADAFADDPPFRDRYKNINPVLRILSFEDLNATIQEDTSASGRETYRDFYYKSLEVTGQAYEHGVKILAGSDVPELPGSSLHDELLELSAAGLPGFEVLRTATLYPAKYYNLQDTYGSVEEGKIADLILLSANPVENIRHTRSIEGVFFEGVYLDNKKLDSINKSTQKTSDSWLMSIKLIRDILISMTL